MPLRNLDQARKTLKTNKELSETLIDELLVAQGKLISKQDLNALDKVLAQIKKITKSEADYLKVLETINKSLKQRVEYSDDDNEYTKQKLKDLSHVLEKTKEIDDYVERTHNAERARSQLQDKALQTLRKMSAESGKIYELAHQMQVQSNLTWRQYTKAYNEAYKAARQMNLETGKQLHQAKDIIEIQNTLLKDGWKNIDLGTLTNVSVSVRTMASTLGAFPEELSTALQSSYKQFGQNTDTFITALGNRLNAFSNTFGVSIGMLTGVVTQMSASTSFLARNNMQAQILANESLLKAAALSGQVGLTSTDFISSLASTSQFGTAQEMQGLYQGGAFLQGFSVEEFQQQMLGGRADQAISSLFSNIYSTMQGVEGDHYLRNEYMRQIGSAFGLSQSDMLNIMTHGGNLDQYDANIQEKLLNIDNSMLDELKGLRIDLTDQLTNWWQNTTVVQGFNKTMQDLGLHGTGDTLVDIYKLLKLAFAVQGIDLAKNGLSGFKGIGTAKGITNQNNPLFGTVIGGSGLQQGWAGNAGLSVGLGLAGMGLSQQTGRAVQTNVDYSNEASHIGAALLNIGGGAASGAMMGSVLPGPGTAIGAGIGATVGIINTILGAQERKSALRDIEDQRRLAARQSGTASSGDPLLDAINRQTRILEQAITGTATTERELTAYIELNKKVSTQGTIIPEP